MIRTLHYSRAAGISILVIACLLMVGGCWGRTEVDDLAFVMSIGLDKGEDNTVYVTFQIAVPRAVAGAIHAAVWPSSAMCWGKEIKSFAERK
jgi:hypothetical protein